MTENLKQLSPPEKKVAAQVLVKNGYSTRTVEDLIGMDHATIAKWAKEETEEGYRQFSTRFEKELNMWKKQGVAMIHKRMQELIPTEGKLDQLVKAGEYLEGKNTNVNIGQIGGSMNIELVGPDESQT